eukprot:6212390-Prymnesium_polylepis.1
MLCCRPPETPDVVLKEGKPLPKVSWHLNPFAKLPGVEALGTFNPKSHPCLSTATVDTVTVLVKQKLFSLTGQSMDIKDTEGNVVAKLGGKFMSLRDRAVLSDANGKPVCCIIERILAMSPSYFIYSFKPYFEGQQPSGEKQDGTPLCCRKPHGKPPRCCPRSAIVKCPITLLRGRDGFVRVGQVLEEAAQLH